MNSFRQFIRGEVYLVDASKYSLFNLPMFNLEKGARDGWSDEKFE